MELDSQWIDEFNAQENLYKPFYKGEVTNVRIVFFYLNHEKEIIYSKKFRIHINNEQISKSQLIGLLKQNMIYNHKKFYPCDLLKYNMKLDPLDVKTYINEPDNYNFLERIYYVNPVSWEKTINFLKPINSIYILMRERKHNRGSTTKKIYISSKKKKTKRKYI